MTPEVTIATIPWRRDNAEKLLRSLAEQTLRAARVTVILDDYAGTPPPVVPDGLAVEFVDTKGKAGAGYRWRHIEAHAADDTLAIVIDDDMAIKPNYIEHGVAEFERLGEPLSWTGTTFDDRWMPCGDEPIADVRLFVLGGSTMFVPAARLRGISKDQQADVLLGVLGDDEALVSWWFANQGMRFWRPRRQSFVWSTKYQLDPRGQYGQRGNTLHNSIAHFRTSLRQRGWPVVDPPPEWPGKNRGW